MSFELSGSPCAIAYSLKEKYYLSGLAWIFFLPVGLIYKKACTHTHTHTQIQTLFFPLWNTNSQALSPLNILPLGVYLALT